MTDRIELQGGTPLEWSNAVLRSSGNLRANGEWFHDPIVLSGRGFPAADAAAMVGRAASDIVDHAAFARIAIRKVASDVVEGRTATVIDLELPGPFFDASTGWSWSDAAGPA